MTPDNHQSAAGGASAAVQRALYGRQYSPGDYQTVWLGSLAKGHVTESWHLDVIQSQFITSEQRAIRRDFVARLTGRATTGIIESERQAIIAAAADILRRHGRKPRISLFWSPQA